MNWRNYSNGIFLCGAIGALLFINSCQRVQFVEVSKTINQIPIDVGKGTDDWWDKDHGSWFVPSAEKTEIQVCIKDPKRENHLKESLIWAFQTWKEYGELHGLPMENNSAFKLKFGACSPQTDLKILVGRENEEVRSIFRFHSNPKAFVVRTEQTPAFWSRGILWLDSFFEENLDTEVLVYRALLLHEVGHLLGNPHVKGTIMDDQALYALIDQQLLQPKALKIDWDCELTGYTPSRGQVTVTHEASVQMTKGLVDFFKEILGEPYWLRIVPEISKIRLVRFRSNLELNALQLTKSNGELLATVKPKSQRLREGTRIRTFLCPSSSGSHPTKMGTYSAYRSQTEISHFETMTGNTLTTVLDYNLNYNDGWHRPTRISLVLDGREVRFAAFPSEPVVTPGFQFLNKED